jgi:hypothetical protein
MGLALADHLWAGPCKEFVDEWRRREADERDRTDIAHIFAMDGPAPESNADCEMEISLAVTLLSPFREPRLFRVYFLRREEGLVVFGPLIFPAFQGSKVARFYEGLDSALTAAATRLVGKWAIVPPWRSIPPMDRWEWTWFYADRWLRLKWHTPQKWGISARSKK